jgi:uncharacterized membrane protein YoaK (UPF0700 family)
MVGSSIAPEKVNMAASSPAGPQLNLLAPLMVLTMTTGIIDAVSFVGLGRVFTANMTGNVVFLGFALAGVEGLSVERSLVALAAFAAGALAGGLLTNRSDRSAAHLFAIGAAAEAVFLGIAAAIGSVLTLPPSWATTHALIILTGIAMGLRNACVRKLGVPDVTTTVLTLTITGLAAESPVARGTGTRSGRKTVSIAAMLIGALIGALMLLTWGFMPPLAIAAVLAGAVSLLVALSLRSLAATAPETKVSPIPSSD